MKSKKTLPNYSPDKAEEFQHESARRADNLFYQQLDITKNNKIIIMGGGAASGETEFLVAHLNGGSKDQIIFDTTLSSIEGARIKIGKIIKAKKQPILYFVLPDDIYRAYTAFLHRDRKFSDKHFFRTHAGSRKTLLWIIENFPQAEIHIIESSYTKQQTMQFTGIIFSNRKELIEYAKKIQISEADIISLVTRT